MAFYECTNLTSIYVYHTTPLDITSTYNHFYNVNRNTCTLYVPKGTKSLYQAAMIWKNFTNIVEFNTSDITPTTVNSVSLCTNPATGAISLSGFEGVATIEVYNVNGQLQLTQTVTTNEPIAAQGLKKGIYLVKVKTSNGETTTKMVVK